MLHVTTHQAFSYVRSVLEKPSAAAHTTHFGAVPSRLLAQDAGMLFLPPFVWLTQPALSNHVSRLIFAL